MKVHLRMRSYPTAKLTYDENEDLVIGYSMSIYDFSEYSPQGPCDSGRANTIPANSVTNTYDATNADGRHADLQKKRLR
jgi:hypothetical protein